jgi:hypothetical protein
MTADVLSLRALNRATLERQLLLRRSGMATLDAVAHLVGLQAQVPLNPYHGLWSRLDGFAPDELAQLLLDRKVVRIVVMRGTLHLVTADDCLVLRPLVQPVLDQELARHSTYGPALRGVDLDAVIAFAAPLLAERPFTGPQLRAAMATQFPDDNPAALAYACRNRLAFVQVPPRGLWGRSGAVASTTAEAWLGRPTVAEPSIDDVVLRYLGAFGPATTADVVAWSRLTGLGEVIDRLRPQLRAFRDERDRKLVDLPDAPRPDPDTPAPPRFLPEYDNVLLSHGDRSRFFGSEERRRRLFAVEERVQGSVLLDGLVAGTWSIEPDAGRDRARLVVTHVDTLSRADRTAIADEGDRLLRFLVPEATDRDVHWTRREG